MSNSIPLHCAIAASLLCSVAHAEIYKCQSAEGKTEYRDRPCAYSEQSQKRIEVAPAPTVRQERGADATFEGIKRWNAQRDAEVAQRNRIRAIMEAQRQKELQAQIEEERKQDLEDRMGELEYEQEVLRSRVDAIRD